MAIRQEERRIRMLGTAQNDVKLQGGRVEAEINREKGITEQELHAFEIEKIRAQREGGLSEEEVLKQRMKKLKLALEEGAISSESYQKQINKLLDLQ